MYLTDVIESSALSTQTRYLCFALSHTAALAAFRASPVNLQSRLIVSYELTTKSRLSERASAWPEPQSQNICLSAVAAPAEAVAGCGGGGEGGGGFLAHPGVSVYMYNE